MSKIRIAYFGTPQIAATVLEYIQSELSALAEISLVVTQPDKPVGRKQILTPSYVKQVATRYSLPIFDGSIKTSPPDLQSYDLALLYAYGAILPLSLLKQPKYGFWNIHPSLLPLYRNTSPIAYSLMLGDTKTGVTLMQMDEKLDHGPIICQESVLIALTDTREIMETKLTQTACELVKKQLEELQKNSYKTHEQNHFQATYTKIFNKNDGYVSFTSLQLALTGSPINEAELPELIKNYLNKYPAVSEVWNMNNPTMGHVLYNFSRGIHPWPGMWTTGMISGEEKRLKITEVDLADSKLIIKKVQLEGKNEVDFKTFNTAYKIF